MEVIGEIIHELLSGSVPIVAGILELVGVIIIALAGIQGVILFIKGGFSFNNEDITLKLVKAMSLTLDFFLAAEILLTALVSSLTGLVQIAGIAGLRIFMHFILHKEIAHLEGEHHE